MSSTGSGLVILAGGPMPESVTSRLAPFARVVFAATGAERDMLRRASNAIAILARGDTIVSKRVIDAAPHLRVIARSGVGVDHVDVAEATRRHVPVVVTPGAGSDAVAEGAMAMMLSLNKNLALLDDVVRRGRWSERENVPVGDLDGSVLGILGLGRIGSRLAQLARAFGMQVLSCDPPREAAEPDRTDVRWVGLDQLVAESDVVSLHLPLTHDTRSIIDLQRLMAMKSGAILLNLGRGGLVSSLDDLMTALEAGPLAGVGLDTFDPEPPDVSHPLFKDHRVILAPHVLGLSRRARTQIFDDMVDGVVQVLSGRRHAAVVNPEVWPDEFNSTPTPS